MKTGAAHLIESRRARRYGSSRHNTGGRRRLNMEGKGGAAFDIFGDLCNNGAVADDHRRARCQSCLRGSVLVSAAKTERHFPLFQDRWILSAFSPEAFYAVFLADC